jgi:hypothetical protein
MQESSQWDDEHKTVTMNPLGFIEIQLRELTVMRNYLGPNRVQYNDNMTWVLWPTCA